MKRLCMPLVAVAALSVAGCPPKDEEDTMTFAEAKEALSEASASTQASELTSTSIELSTNFTIGSAVEAAADELRTFVETQLPCAQITLQNASLTIEYGAKAGNCTYRGHTFTGLHTVRVSKNDQAEVKVEHTWTELSNGVVKVSGTATVTWNLQDKTRHVVHELDWTRVSDHRSGKGSGDRTQSLLPGGLAEGIQVNGARWWDGDAGHWDLAIQNVQLRWADPVPQSGAYKLITPKDKTLSLAFTRVDEDTISVKVSSGSRSFSFNVSKATGLTE